MQLFKIEKHPIVLTSKKRTPKTNGSRNLSPRGFAALLLVLGSACQLAPPKGMEVAPLPALPTDERGWIKTRETQGPSGVTVTETQMPPQELAQREREYKESALQPFPIPAEFNANLFTLRGVPAYGDYVAIAPRVYAYGSRTKGRLVPKQNNDGTVTIPFSIIFTDGTAPTVSAPDEESTVNLPEQIMVQNLEEMKKHLVVRSGEIEKTLKLVRLPGCPKEIYVLAHGKRFNVTPLDLSGVADCEINRPQTVALTLPIEDAWHFLQNDLYTAQAEIDVVWETRLPITTAAVSLKIDRSRLLDSLKAELGVKVGPYVAVDLKAHLAKIIRSQLMEVVVEGEANQYVERLMDIAFRELADPWDSKEAIADDKCGKDQKEWFCVGLNFQRFMNQSHLEVRFDHQSLKVRGQHYRTMGKLRSMTDRESSFTIDNFKSPWSELGLTVVSGDVLEIDPKQILLEKRALDEALSFRNSNPVCVEKRPVIAEVCHLELRPILESPVCVFAPLLCLPVPKRICHNEQVGEECARTEDHYTDVTRYGTPDKGDLQLLDSEKEAMPNLLSSLALRFTGGLDPATGKPKTWTCSVALFQREASGHRIRVKLENVAGCAPFQEEMLSPLLALGNQMSIERKELLGEKRVRFDSTVESEPTEVQYSVKSKIIGHAWIRGYSFSSEASRGFQQSATK